MSPVHALPLAPPSTVSDTSSSPTCDTAQVVIWLPWDAPSIVEKGKDMDVHSWPSAGPPGMRKDLVGKISDGAREGGSGKRSSGIFLVLHNQFFALLLLPSSLPVPSSSSFFLGFPPPHLGLHGIELAQHPFEFGDVVGEVVDVVLRDLVVGDVDRL